MLRLEVKTRSEKYIRKSNYFISYKKKFAKIAQYDKVNILLQSRFFNKNLNSST